ncbi:hypothetical protein [Echinimonas agarilytica]|uniref:Uncharacterized protein n=1 Tax=Echinimonas agarilytica TaxID=1215918 RepID=A0AA42B838_9GAMM|nr:hypothetical protein [Echinimonas agarilytica]MCM2680469.1 hypothetical protein [Echinimonas agarilytica]
MTRLFLIPILLCVMWWLFLQHHKLTIKQGAKGFYLILGFCGAFAVFLTTVMWLLQ